MAGVTANDVMELRRATGLPVVDCRTALIEAEGDPAVATRILRERGNRVGAREGRTTGAGRIFSYVHQGRIGVLVSLLCETDFAAGTSEFEGLGTELCLQVASMSPRYVGRDDVPSDVMEQERSILINQTIGEGKPERIVGRIVEGRMGKFYSEACLLEQPSIRDGAITVERVIADVEALIGESIRVSRFVRETI